MLLIQTTAIKKALRIFILLGMVAVTSCSTFAQNLNTPNNNGPLGTQVNTLSGNLFIPRTDLFIPGRSMSSIDISFYYNSFNYYKNLGYGNGWTFKYGMRYTTDTTGAVTIFQGDDREDKYTSASNGSFIPPTGIFDVLKEYQSGKYLLSTKGGMQYYFDNGSSKRLTKMIEPNGNYLTFSYSDTLITSISNSAGQTVSLTYAKGLLTSVIDALASPTRTFTHEYDAYGNLIKVTDPAGYNIKYKYLINGPMSETTDKNDNTANIIYYSDYSISELISCNSRKSFSYDTTANITTVTDYVPGSSNQVTTYHYKKFNDIAWVTSISGNCCGFDMLFEFDNDGNMVKKTDANGNIYTYTYDNNGNLSSITDPLSRKSFYTYTSDFNKISGYTDAKGNTYTIEYDKKGNAIKFTEPGGIVNTATYSSLGDVVTWVDGNGNSYEYKNDAFGNTTQITNPLNASVSNVYDSRGNLTSTTDPNGNTYSRQYDLLNRLTSITDPLSHVMSLTYDPEDNITSFSDQNGNKRIFTYDASNRLTSLTDALGQINRYSYDAVNNLVSYKDKMGNTTFYAYDNRNRVSLITDAVGNKYSYKYDNNGNVESVTLPNGHTINYTYGKTDKLINSSDETGNIGSLSYDNNDNVTGFTNGTGATLSAEYDANDRLVRLIDPLGNSTTLKYDNNHNLLSYKDRNGRTMSYGYDAIDQITKEIDKNNFSTTTSYDAAGNVLKTTDAKSNATIYSYDALGRQITKTFADGSAVRYKYDNSGRIISKQMPDGTEITYEYNAVNRVTKKTIPGNAFIYNYDAKGRLINAMNNAGTISFSYDPINRLASEGFNGRTTSYFYDLSNKTLKIIYPDSSNIIKTYDFRNRLTDVQKDGLKLATYQYNNANQFLEIGYTNGITTNFAYDFANRLSTLTTSSSGIINKGFTYDNAMNKIAVKNLKDPEHSQSFSYDAASRLTGYKEGLMNGEVISSALQQETFTYDSSGNRVSSSINGDNTSYAANSLNQYLSVRANNKNINFTYDKNGNLTYDGSFYKTYDAEGRLLSDSSAGAKLVYQYDVFGRRVSKTFNNQTTAYFYSGLAQIEQRDGDEDTLINRFVYSASAFMPVWGNNNYQKYFFHQNELNSVEALTDENGRLIEQYHYDPYGNTSIYDSLNNLISASRVKNRFGFTGQECDLETNTYHFPYRNYSPVTGNFQQRDPLGYADGMSLYQYVHDNPANRIDPLGLKDCHTPRKVIYVSEAEWEKEVNQMREKYNKNAAWGFVGNAVGFDSRYHNESVDHDYGPIFYKFRGKLYTSTQLNYYFEGMLAKANGYSRSSLNHIVNTWRAQYNFNGSYSAWMFVHPFDNANIAYYDGADDKMLEMANLGYDETDQSSFEHTALREEDDAPVFEPQQTYHSKFKDPDNLPVMPPDRNGEYRPVINPETNQIEPYFFPKYDAKKRVQELRAKKVPCPPNDNNGGTNKRTPPGPRKPGTTGKTIVLNSKDPNEIIGPTGVGTPKWVAVNDNLPYTILFENSTAASAPAKTVKVTYPVDPKQDMNNFSLGSFGFNNLTFNIPPNTPSYYQRLNVIDSLGLYVDVTAGLDVVKHEIFWMFQSIDPITQLPPTDPLKGFLKLRDTANSTSGHGFVNFTIKPNSSSNTGDTIHATAAILFDLNDTIPTNIAKNTIDAVAPTSHMNSLPATTNNNTIPLSWAGQDDAAGSGLKSYTLYISENGGGYQVFQSGMTRTDTTFTGAFNNTYTFFVLATDSAGNVEGLRPGSEVTVLISNGALPITWSFFNANLRGKDGVLSWATASETNSKEFEIERSVDGHTFTTIGNVSAKGNSSVQSNYAYTDLNVVALNIPVVYYRLRQTDKDGKVTYSNVVALQLPTTLEGPIVKAYPNPFKQSLNVMIANAPQVGANDKIELYTLEGKLVYRRMIGRRVADASINLDDLPQLTPGMYILKLDLNKQKFSFKVVKQ